MAGSLISWNCSGNDPDRKEVMDKNKTESVWLFQAVAKCGHEDSLGYLTGTACGKCAKRNHRKATKGRR